MSGGSRGLVLLALAVVGACLAPAEDFQLLVLAGQSNAVGYGSDANLLPPELYQPQGDVLFWFEEGPWNAVHDPERRIRSDEWVALQFQSDPYFGTFGPVIDGFGPEIKLGRTLADSLPANVALVKFAINATSLAHDWDPNAVDSLYDQMLAELDEALLALNALGHTGTVVGFFWMQGEWDARDPVDAGNYAANLTNFILRLRDDLGVTDLPFVFGRLNQYIYLSPYGIAQEDLATVRAAQESVAAEVPFAAIVDTDDLPLISDFIHFAAEGQLSLGERFAGAFLSLIAVVGDLDGDGDVDLTDLAILLAAYDTCAGDPNYNPAADLNSDGCVNLPDLAILLAHYGEGT